MKVLCFAIARSLAEKSININYQLKFYGLISEIISDTDYEVISNIFNIHLIIA